jgi:hypothetical protein
LIKFDNFEYLIHVEDVCLDYENDDITGRIKDGGLDMRECIRPIRIVWNKRDQATWGGWCEISIACPYHRHAYIYLDAYQSNFPTFHEDNAKGGIFCMPVYFNLGIGLDLLLLRSIPIRKGWLERIGLDHRPWRESQGTRLTRLDEETKKPLPCLHYDGEMHTIRII